MAVLDGTTPLFGGSIPNRVVVRVLLGAASRGARLLGFSQQRQGRPSSWFGGSSLRMLLVVCLRKDDDDDDDSHFGGSTRCWMGELSAMVSLLWPSLVRLVGLLSSMGW